MAAWAISSGVSQMMTSSPSFAWVPLIPIEVVITGKPEAKASKFIYLDHPPPKIGATRIEAC